jgi:hypothetical protein
LVQGRVVNIARSLVWDQFQNNVSREVGRVEASVDGLSATRISNGLTTMSTKTYSTTG